MPTSYQFTENGVVYNFDDVFVPAEFFRNSNLWVWGNNQTHFSDYNSSGFYVRLGVGGYYTSSDLNPYLSAVSPVTTILGRTTWKKVSCSRDQTAAIKDDGTLWTWGKNAYGELGNAVTTDRSTPVTTFLGGTNWKEVACGVYVTSAIKSDGTLWTWGRNDVGQLGNAVTDNRSTPVTTFLGGTNWKQLSSGLSYSAAIKTDGTLWTWGYGATGRLGNNDTTDRSTPVTTFLGGNNWKEVSCGYRHAAAVKTDGSLWTWGNGFLGKLGNATTTGNVSIPGIIASSGTGWKTVSAGYYNTGAIKTDGTLWVWGLSSLTGIGVTNTYTGTGNLPLSGYSANVVGARTNSITGVTFASSGVAHSVGDYIIDGTSVYHSTVVFSVSSSSSTINTSTTLFTSGTFNAYPFNSTVGTSLRLLKASIGDGIVKSTPVTTFLGGNDWKQISITGDTSVHAIKTNGTMWYWGRPLGTYVTTPVQYTRGPGNWKFVTGVGRRNGTPQIRAISYEDPTI